MKISSHPRTKMTTTYSVSTEVLMQEFVDTAVLLDLSSEQYFQLNTTGMRIWKLLAELQTPEQIAQAIAVDTDAPLETLRGDVAKLIDQLLGARLIAAKSS